MLLSADPIIGMAAIMLPDDGGHDFLIHDAYQGDTAAAPDSASHAGIDQVLATAGADGMAPVAPAATASAASITISSSAAAAAPTASAAGATIASSDPTRTIFLGDDVTGGLDSNGALYISNAALGDLTGGYSHILVGGADSNAHIVIGDTSGNQEVLLNDALTLMNPQAGGEIFINQKLTLQGDSGLTIFGSGHTTIISSAVSASFAYVSDSIKIDATNAASHTVTLTATNGGIQLGSQSSHTLNGFGTAPDDHLVLSATGDIEVYGTVGDTDPLEGLAVSAAHDVHFRDAVTVNGNLDIHASGTVTFEKAVHLTAGGLHITGATLVYFKAGVVIDGGGDVVLEGNEIDLSMGEGGFVGTGSLTLRPSTVGMNIDIGGPPLENSSDLNLSVTDLAAFTNTFSKIIIGRQDGLHADHLAGDVRIGAIQTAQQYTVRDQLEVYGNNITVEDFATSGYNFMVDGNITLDAYNNITLYNRVEAHNANLVLYADGGAISQLDANGTDNVGSEPLRAYDLHAHAGNGINLPWLQVNTVSAVNTGDGNLTIGNLARDATSGIGGALQIDEVSQTSLLGDAIAISTSGGAITIAGSGVHTVSGGAIGISAGGAGSTVLVNQGIGGTSGAIGITADGAINVALGSIADSGAGAISLGSTSGAISVAQNISSAGGLVRLAAGAAIGMVSGTSISSIDPSGDSGAVALVAGGDITVSIVAADGSIGVASSAGAIIDGLTGNGNNLDGDSAIATLAAATGIGSGVGVPLYTRVAALSASNTVAGNVMLREATALRLLGASLAGSGASLSILTADGALVVEGLVNSAGTSGAGNILLQSGEAGEATAADIEVRANLSSNLGNISLIAADSVRIDDLAGGAPLIEARGAGKTIDVKADGTIVFEALAQLKTNNGNIRLDAQGGDLTLGIVNAGTGALSLTASGNILDGQLDDAGSRLVNLTAASVRLSAGGTIGSTGDTLELQAGVLALSGRASYTLTSGASAVGSVAAVAVNRVAADAATSSVADAAALAGASTTNGDLVLTGADLTIDQAMVAGGGNLRLQAGGTLVANAALTAGASLTVISSAALTQNASAVFSALTGTIDVMTTAGALIMVDGARAITNAANIRYQSVSSVFVGLLDARSNADRGAASLAGQAGWGNVSVVAGARIVDTDETGAATDIYAAGLRLSTAAAIGTDSDYLDIEAAVLSASSGTAMFISEAGDLTLDTVGAISVNRVLLDGSVTGSLQTDAASSDLRSNSRLALAVGGALTSLSDGAINASSYLLVGAGGDISLGAAVSAGNSLSINAGRDLLQAATIAASNAGHSIDLFATRDIRMADGSRTASNNGNIGLQAGAAIVIETLDAGSAAVSVSAGSDISDQDASGDSEVDILAGSLLLKAGGAIGSGANAIETSVATLAARAGNGGLFIAETDALELAGLSVSVNRVDSTGMVADIVTTSSSIVAATGAGAVVIRAGALTVSDAVSASAGKILLQAASGDLLLNNAVSSSSGAISLAAGAALTQKASVSGASVDAMAATALSMDDGVVTSASGNIRYQAGANLALGTLNSDASVSLVAASVSDSGASDTDIIASALRLQVAGAVGSGAAHLQSTIGSLAGNSGSLFLDETDALRVVALNDIVTARVASDGSSAAVTDLAVTNLAANGALVIASGASLTVDAAVSASGNVLLAASGATSDVLINQALASSAASISVAAGRDLLVGAGIGSNATSQSVDLQALRDIGLAEGSVVNAAGNIALVAGRNATIELLASSAGSVSVTAVSGAIIDGDGAGDAEEDIRASSLLLRAASGIGAAGNHLETNVAIVSAQGGSGGVYLSETNTLNVGSVSVQVNRIDSAGLATLTSNAAQGKLGASGSGNIVLRSAGGVLTIADGVDAVSGNILLQAASGGMVVNGAINAAGGAISLVSAGALAQKANIATSGAGTIDLAAASVLSMDDGTSVRGAANIRASAGTTMTVGAISTSGAVSLQANAFADSGSSDIDVTAGALRMAAADAAGSGIGSGAAHLQVAVATLAASSAASAAASGIYLDAAGSIVIDNVAAVAIDRVGSDGATSVVQDAALSDLVSGARLVLAAGGAITVNQGSANATGVRAAGNLLLQASGASADVTLNAEVASSGGSISIVGGRDILAASSVIASASGASIELAAVRAVTMANASLLQTNDGNIGVRAGSDATVELLDAGSGGIAVNAGAGIIDQDGAGDSEVDLIGGAVQLSAGTAIGSAASALETRVASLGASAGSGGLYLSETDALLLGSVAVQVNRVGADGIATLGANAALAGATTSGSGQLAIVAGDLTIDGAVGSAAGAVLLSARSGNLTQHAAVSSASGAISLLAAGALAQQANISGGASVDVSAGAALSMDAASLTSAVGNVRYAAGSSLSVGAIATNASTGMVSLNAASIVDAGGSAVDVSASALRLYAGSAGDTHLQTAVSTIAASIAGGLSVTEADGLTVGSVAAIDVSRLALDGSIGTVGDASLSGVTASGRVLLQTAAGGDLTLAGALQAGASVSLDSARDIVQNAAIGVVAAGSSIELLAARAIVMGEAAVSNSNAGNIRLAAGTGIAVGLLDARSAADRGAASVAGQAGWGAVSLVATGAIVDASADNASNGSPAPATDVYASALRLAGSGAGSAANGLETAVASLAAALGSGGMFVANAGAITLASLAPLGVERVAYDGSVGSVSDAALAGVAGAGAVVVQAAGQLQAAAAVAAAGNLLLRADADLVVDAPLASSGGSISLAAGRDIVQNAAIATAASGQSIDLLAGRHIAMGAGSSSATVNGNLLLQAAGDVIVATLAAGSGSVAIDAGASIVDQDGAGDSRINIGAAGLQLMAGNAIGSGANHLELAVASLSAQAGAGGIFLIESDGLSVAALTVQALRVDASGVASATAHAGQADLRTSAGGNIVLVSTIGAITLNDGDANASAVAAGGNVLLAADSLAVNASVVSAAGNVSLVAAGAIAMAGSSTVSGAQVRLAAGTNVTLGTVNAVDASIIAASGSIGVSAGANGNVNVSAASLRLQAGQAIGSGASALRTAVDTLAASAAGMFIGEADGVRIDAAASVLQVNRDGGSGASADAAVGGLLASGNGSIVVRAGGSVQLAAQRLVSAAGSGNVLLQALAGAIDLGADADLVSGSGHLSVIAGSAITLAAGADLRTGGSGDIDIDAGAAFSQASGSVIVNDAGNIVLQAGTDVALASIASAGNVAVTAVSGAIVDDGDAAVDIAAEGLRLSAGAAIGSLGNAAKAINIAVGTVSARAGSGGINLSEANDIVVGDVAVTVNVVGADGSLALATLARQADLRTSGNGGIVLDAANSFIILNEGSGAADGAVVADGAGNVRLHAGVSIIVNADIISASGHLTLLGNTLIEMKANADLRTGAAGSIDVEAAGGAIVQHATSVFTSGSGSIVLRAQSNVTIGDIVTGGDVAISAVDGFIADADALVGGANDADVDVSAASLRLSAGSSIGMQQGGSVGNAIDTAVATLSARAGGALAIANSGALTLGSVAVGAFQVGADGAAVALATPAQSGIAASTVNLAASGAIVIGDGVAVSAGSGAASIDAGGALSMAGSASVSALGNNLRLHAAADLVIGNLVANNVSLVSDSGAIVNAAGSSKNVSASTLRLQADDAIGSAARHLSLAVGTLSAVSRGSDSGGIYLSEDDALVIGSTGFGVDAAQTDLRAGSGAIVVDAGGAVSMAGSVSLVSSGAMALHAASLTLGNLSAASVSLTTDSGAIVNAAGSSKNVSAASLLVRAAGALGSGSRAISTAIGSIDAVASAIYLAEDDAVDVLALSAVGASGNLVLTSANGAIGVAGAVTATRNVLLGAGGASADLAVTGAATVTSSGGSISLRAGRDLLVDGAVRASAAAQTLDLLAGRDLAIGAGAAVRTSDGALLLSAGGDVVFGGGASGSRSIDAGSAAVGIGAGGSVRGQGAAAGGIDVAAGSLRLSAGAAIGSAAQHLHTQVATVAAKAGDGLYLDEGDGLTIGSVDLTVSRIDASAAKTSVGNAALAGLSAAGTIDLAAGATVTQLANVAAASVRLQTPGSIAMSDGVVTSAAAIVYSAGGDLLAGLFDGGSGSVLLGAGGNIADAQPAAAVPTLNVRAGSLRMDAGGNIGNPGNAIETAVGTLAAGSGGDLAIGETDDLRIDRLAAGGNVVVALAGGTLDLAASFSSASGRDLRLAADHIVIEQAVSGHGGTLSLGAGGALADVGAGSGGVIDQASLAQLRGGFAQVVLGAGVAGSGQDLRLDGSASALHFADPLLLDVSGSGSVVTVAGALGAHSIDARGAVAIDGVASIAADGGANANALLFEHSIDGAAAGAFLTLAAGGGDVVVGGAIGANIALAGLTIDDAVNIHFAQAVNVAGAVVIHASGVVRFDGPLVLTNGSLTIDGASAVIIGDVVVHGRAGSVVIEANTLTLNGDVEGAGTVLLRPTDISRDIVVGDGAGVAGGAAYSVSNAQLAHLASATTVVIGSAGSDGHAAAGAGAVTVAAIDFAALTAAPVQIFGSSVTVAAGAGTLQAANGLQLDGRDGVVLHDSIGSKAGDISVYSANGGVTMDAGSVIAGSAAVSIGGAGDLVIGLVQGKSVSLRSSGGAIVDAAADNLVNISADSVAIIGYGPKLGSGNAIEVQAPAIYVAAPSGMVLQDTGSDGRTHFYLLDGATMYEQAIAIGAVTRATAAPALPVAASAAAATAPAAPAISLAAPGFAVHVSSAAAYLAGLDTLALAGAVAAGSDGLQAAPAAAQGALAAAFDYWLEDLTL